MDFIEGRSFSDLIEEGTDESLRRGLVVLSKVCRALDYAHKRGIVHRDIKPDNLLLDRQDEPYITDFGIAKDREQDLKLTSTQAAMGTPYYMSPEQANGELHRVGPLSDVYSLGATMFHLLTGRVPFVGDSLFSLMLQLLSEEVERPTLVAKRVLGRDLPQALEVICLKAMEKEAGRRYESAAALADDIDAYLAEKPIQARPLTSGERLKKLIKRNRAVFAGVAIVLGLLIVMVLAFGTLLVVNLQKTAQSLREQDRKAALDQAATLQRAIGTNMLEGRADIVRSLVGGLRKDRSIASINVVRVDKTFAYTDLSTRRFVDKRLADPKTLAWIEKHHPRLMGKVSELKRVGFHNIDEASKELTALLEKGETQRFQSKEVSWNQALVSGRPLSFLEEHKAKRVLTVYWPIKNGKPCQACHGEVGKKLYDGYYGSYGTDKLLQSNQMRGMLVVRRSQEDVEARIRENQRAVLLVAAATTVALFWLILIFTRIFDIGLKPQSFGAQGEPKSEE
jgi:serine/threonine protein kinase